MSILHRTALLLAANCLLALASCGSGSSIPAANEGNPAFKTWVAQQSWDSNLSAATGTDGLPAFPAENGPRVASAGGGSQTVAGAASIQQRFAEVDGDALIIGPAPGGQGQNTAYGMYRFSGLGGTQLIRLSIGCLPQNIEMRYYVALADFTNLRWHWWGPISLPEFNINFENQAARFISPLGNAYMLIATHESNITRHSHSVLTYGEGGGGEGDPQPPGAPTGLIASDGTFPDGIGLTWQPSEAAQWYRIFRRNLDPANGTEGEWGVVGESQAPEYFDNGRAPGVVHHYKVQAARTVGNQILHSGFSNIDTGFAAEEQGGDGYVIQGVIGDNYRAGTKVTLLGADEEPLVRELGENGSFRFDGLHAGIYIVYPYNPNCQFAGNFWCDDIGPNNPEVNLTFAGGPLVNLHRAWGFIYKWEVSQDGTLHFVPVSGVPVKVWKDGQGDVFQVGESGECGFYEVFENQQGLNIIKPYKEGWQFTPGQAVVEINSQQLPQPRNFRGHGSPAI